MKMAFDWYRKAADAGNSEAMIHLYMFYRFGKQLYFKSGTSASVNTAPVDIKEAKRQLENAGALGDTRALKILAEVYTTGIADPVYPVKPDVKKALDFTTRFAASRLDVETRCGLMRQKIAESVGEQPTQTYGVAIHSHAFVCLAEFKEPKNGDIVPFKRIIFYFASDWQKAKPIPVPAREELMTFPDDTAIVESARKGK
jgi:hypothetical protein